MKSAHWQRVRRERLTLAGGRCELKLSPRCTGVATHCHLNPDFRGDHNAATMYDVRACCAHCHGTADAPRSSGHQAVEPPQPFTRSF